MSTLAIVEVVLREAETPLTVRDIVRRAGGRLPSRSKTPETVVARDLSLDIKRLQDASRFVRTAPGQFTMRDLAMATTATAAAGGLLPMTAVLRGGAPAGPLAARPSVTSQDSQGAVAAPARSTR